MRKILIVLTVAFASLLTVGFLNASPNQFDRNVPRSVVNQRQINNLRIKTPPLLISGTCPREGQVDCDDVNKRFRKCKDGFWESWRGPTSSELEILSRCTEDCHPGIYYCNYRDHAYHYCQENGTWWPGGGGWETLPPNSDPQLAEIRRQCEATDSRERSIRNGESQCWPGSYRCFNDGGYNMCGDEGWWSHSGTTSPDFAGYLNYCVYPRH